MAGHKEREDRLEEEAEDTDGEGRPDDLSADIPVKATITIKELNDNRDCYCQWRDGNTVTSGYNGPVNPDE